MANNLTSLGIELPPEQEKALLEKIKELGERKETVTADDLPFLIEDLFGGLQTRFVRITDIRILTEINQSPSAELALELDGKEYRASSSGDGGYDAFMNALGEIASQINLILPELVDYEVRIPPGGKTDALVETVITWKTKDGASAFRTVGVDSDQMIAAVKATEKMLNRLFIANPAVVGKAAE